MSVVYLNDERYCPVCSKTLPPDDPPGSMCRDCWYRRRAPRGARVEPVTSRVTTASVTPEVASSVTSAEEPCVKCGQIGAHTPEACKQRRYRQRRSQA